jgi:hypothetical protein
MPNLHLQILGYWTFLTDKETIPLCHWRLAQHFGFINWILEREADMTPSCISCPVTTNWMSRSHTSHIRASLPNEIDGTIRNLSMDSTLHFFSRFRGMDNQSRAFDRWLASLHPKQSSPMDVYSDI